MKKITLFLFFTLGLFTYCNAQTVVWSEDNESATVGDASGTLFYQLEGGTGTIQNATGAGNTTKVLKAIHNSTVANLYVRTKNLQILEGEEYKYEFDISQSNAVYTVSMRITIDDSFMNTIAVQPTSTITTNGTPSATTPGRVDAVTTNTFGRTTTTFTIPALAAGYNNARIQIYQFGAANTLELDNVIVTKTKDAPTASLEDLRKFGFNASPNPATDYINLSASKNISKIEIYNVVGQQVESRVLNSNNNRVNVSNLSKGIYIMKAFIEDAVGTYKFVKE